MKNSLSKISPQGLDMTDTTIQFDFFAAAGWQPKEIKYFAEEAQGLHRPAPFPWHIRLITSVLGLLMPPEKRRAMKQYAGFVMFEPKLMKD